jgi:predicted transcriptional regulator
LDRAAKVLEQIVKTPKKAPTRIMSTTGIAYRFVYLLLDAQLVEYVGGKKRWNNRLRLTDKGREFVRHYRVLETLLPQV